MKAYPFKKINSFTRGGSAGNPAGCIYLDKSGEISEEEMQLIARELKGYVNEVVYILPNIDSIFLRYYSAECEVDFCGHGTIACMYDYVCSRADLLSQNVIKIRVKNGHLNVYNRLKDDGCVYIEAPEPEYNALDLKKAEIDGALNMVTGNVRVDTGTALINAGLNTLIVPISSLATCLGIMPDEMKLKAFCLDNGIDIILVFTQETAVRDNDYRTRVFAPKYGYLEDPATGSGNSAFAYYLLNRGIWDGGTLSIEQNNSYDCPNIVNLSTVQSEGKARVIFGGEATVKIDGLYMMAV